MERIPFESQKLEAGESIMFVQDLNVSEIRFKHDSREISVVYQKSVKYTEDELQKDSWRQVKKLVLKEGGKWTTKKDGIKFLLGVI